MRSGSSGSARVSYPSYSRDEVIARLRQELRALSEELGIVRAVLFGSYATGRQTVASDIDLLVVVRHGNRDEVYKALRKKVGLRGLEPHVLTLEEYEAMRGTLWIRTVEREGVVIV